MTTTSIQPTSNDDAIIFDILDNDGVSATSQVFTLNDFGQYSSDTNGIKISAIPTIGSLQYDTTGGGNWTTVAVNKELSLTDISSGRLRFVPSSSATTLDLVNTYSDFSFQVKKSSGTYSDSYKLKIYRADIDDDLSEFLNTLQTGFTSVSSDETSKSAKITVAPSADLSTLIDSGIFSIIASKGLEKLNGNNYVILNSPDESIGGYYVQYGIGNINPFTTLSSKLNFADSDAQARLEKIANVSGMPSFAKSAIDELNSFITSVDKVIDKAGSYELNLNVKISDDGQTLQIPLAGSHNTDNNVSLSEIGVALSTSIDNYAKGFGSLVLGASLGDSDYATILASDSISAGGYVILKVKNYDPTQNSEPSLSANVALSMDFPWNPLKPNELSLGLGLSGSVNMSGWSNPFGLSDDIAINSFGLATALGVTVEFDTAPKISEVSFDLGISAGSTIRNTDDVNLAAMTGVEYKMPDQDNPPELNLSSVAFSIDTNDDPVSFGNVLRLMEGTAKIDFDGIETINKAFDKATISSIDKQPLFSFSSFSTDQTIGTETIKTGLYINGEMTIANAFSSSVVLNIDPNPGTGNPYIEAGFDVSIPVIGNMGVTLDIYDSNTVKLDTSFGSINVNINDFNLGNIPKIIENQVTGQLGQLASWVEGQLEDIGASTLDLATDAASAITGTYKEVSGEIQNIAGNVSSAISSGATSAFKSITKALGLSSNQDAPITWIGTDGNDKHDGHHERGDFLVGNGGNDYIWADQGDDSIDGGAGNDTLVGYDNEDQMNGGDGNDTLRGEDGEDSSYGGAGNDYLDEYRNNSGDVLGDAYSDLLDGGTGNDTLLGGKGHDSLYGGMGNDSLDGGEDNDTLSGGAGNDAINGGNGTDTVDFSDENSGVKVTMSGSSGTATTLTTGTIYTDTLSNLENIIGTMFADYIAANSSNNVIKAGDGNNSIWGASGNDYITAGSGNDTIDGGTGNDTVQPGDGNDTVSGGGGTDTIDYSATSSAVSLVLTNSSATVIAADGDDILSAIDIVIGSKFADTLTGDSNNNSFSGNDGNDTLNGAAGNDTLDGGSGSDTVDYSFVTGAGITVDLNGSSASMSANSSNAGADTLKNIESLIGTSNADKLVGDSNSNVFIGGGSNDSIYGDSGNDTLDGGTGNDYMDGNDGNDSLIGDIGDDSMLGGNDQDSLNGGSGNDTLNGNDGYDTLIGGEGNDTLYGGNDTDTLDGGLGNDRLDGGSGDDMADYSWASAGLTITLKSGATITGAAGNDYLTGIDGLIGTAFADNFTGDTNNSTLFGDSGNDTLSGNNGNDSITGDDGNDYILGDADQDSLNGGSGNDSIDGGSGNDTIDGGSGNDTLKGGEGKDVFKFTTSSGADTISEFSSGNDKIDLSSIDANTVTTGDQAFSLVTSSSFTGAGQLRFDSATKTLYGNVDSDTDAEFSVLLTGITAVTSSNFTL